MQVAWVPWVVNAGTKMNERRWRKSWFVVVLATVGAIGCSSGGHPTSDEAVTGQDGQESAENHVDEKPSQSPPQGYVEIPA